MLPATLEGNKLPVAWDDYVRDLQEVEDKAFLSKMMVLAELRFFKVTTELLLPTNFCTSVTDRKTNSRQKMSLHPGSSNFLCLAV